MSLASTVAPPMRTGFIADAASITASAIWRAMYS
jgi:hypothetical protein